MADMMQLDKASAAVGKSEVTLRRLIKAGKIPFQKEKTLTGFIYQVDPDQVKAYYQMREGGLFAEDSQDLFVVDDGDEEIRPLPQSHQGQSVAVKRVAIAGESGSASEYWQKKSESYEDKYNNEVVRHSQTREELGVWRGRAEQSQSMLMKLLPAPTEVEIRQTPQNSERPVVARKDELSISTVILITILIVLLLVAIGAVFYLKIPH